MAPGPFSGLLNADRGAAAEPRRDASRAGIQSLEQGLSIMRMLAAAPGPVALKQIASQAGMSSSKAHRYLASLVRTGWARRAERDGLYQVGPGAIEMGVQCIRNVNVVREGFEQLRALCDATGSTSALAVWGTRSPTILAIEESGEPVSMNVRPGTSAPLLCSAVGLVFAAFSRRGAVRERVDAEWAANAPPHGFRSREALAARLEQIRHDGFAAIDSTWVPGVRATASPVLDHQGEVAAVLLVLAAGRGHGAAPVDPTAALLRAAGGLSRAIGGGDIGTADGRDPPTSAPPSRRR